MEPHRVIGALLRANHEFPFRRQRLWHHVLDCGLIEMRWLMMPALLFKTFENDLARTATVNGSTNPTFFEFHVIWPPEVPVSANKRRCEPPRRSIGHGLGSAKRYEETWKRVRWYTHDHSTSYERMQNSQSCNEFVNAELSLSMVFIKSKN